jgi:hypothetical protein
LPNQRSINGWRKYIPHKKLGKRVVFIQIEIDEWVLNNGIIVKDLPKLPICNIEKEEKRSDKGFATVTYTHKPAKSKYFTVKYRQSA